MAVNATDPGIYTQLARIGKSVASPHRIQLLELLAQGERTVEQLAAEAGLSVNNTSAHLRQLSASRLVESRAEGKYRVYRLADDAVAAFVVSLYGIAERRLAELREFSADFMGARERLTPVEGRKLLERIRRGEVIALDVRDTAEFEAGHIPGARSVPLAELERALRTLPRDREIVAYCRGSYCGLSEKAVAILQRKGFRARRLHEGAVEWRVAGFPVERETSTCSPPKQASPTRAGGRRRAK